MKKTALLFALLAISGMHVFAAAPSNVPVVWHSLDSMPLLGSLAPDASAKYSRLPDALKDSVRPDLWALRTPARFHMDHSIERTARLKSHY